MQISKRAARMPESPIRKLVPYADAAKKKGRTVYHLNIGQPDIQTPHDYLRNIKKLAPKVVTYGKANGELEFRKAWTHYYKTFGIKLSPDNFMVTTGGSEAILFALSAICDPKDNIIIFEPLYANYMGYAAELNINIKPVSTKADDGFHLPSERSILKAIDKKTKAIVICSPANPTGTAYRKKELEMLLNIARKKDLFIIADEVYREFIYQKRPHISMLSLKDTENRVIVIDSLSKRYSLCGARLGCLVTRNQDVLTATLKFAQARLSAPMLPQLAATPLLKYGKKYYKDVITEYEKREEVVYTALKNIRGVTCRKPRGALYVFPKLPIKDSDHFAQWLLTDFHDKKETVMVAPGTGFYATPGKGKQEIRIAYVLEVKKLTRAMELLTAGLAVYTKKYE